MSRALAELAPQPRQVDVDGALAAAVRLVPHLREDLPLRDDLARPLGEEVEQVELAAGQLDGLAVEGHLACHGVDDEAADGERALVVVRVRAPEDRAHPRLELVHGERLDDVVVGSGVEGADDRRVVVAGGDDDDRGAPHRPEHRQQAVAVEVGQAQVEQDEVGLVVEDALEARHRRGRAGHRVPAVGERAHEGGPDRGVVLDDEHVCHSGHGRAGRGRHA